MRLSKIVVETVTVVKFRVDNRGNDGTECNRIEVRTDTAELADKRIARDLTRECKMFIKDKTMVACRMSGIE